MTYIYFLIGQLGYDVNRDSRHGEILTQFYSPDLRHNFLMTDSIVFYFYLADSHYIRPCGPAWRDYMLHYMFDSR